MSAPLPWFLENPKRAKEVYRDPKYSYLVLDFEATTKPGGPLNPANDLVLACWTVVTPDGTWKQHKFGNEYDMRELLDCINGVDFIVAQNAKYELQWLHRCGVDLRNVLVWDTFLAEWVLLGNRNKRKSLRAMALRYGAKPKQDLIAKLWDCGIDTPDIPPSWLLSYCKDDVESTHTIFLKQLKLVYERSQQHLVFSRCLTAAALAEIEFNGMDLDPSRVNEEYEKLTKELAAAEEELSTLCQGINLGSPKQLGVFLYEVLKFEVPKDRKGKPLKTDSGGYPTASPVLAVLKSETPEQERFLSLYRRFNKLDSLLSKNLSFFKGVVDHNNANFRAVFNQGITQTHRLSSSGLRVFFPNEKKGKSVQFQNLPREYKRLFWAGTEDYLIGEADGSQLEFRVAADICRDSVAWQEIADGTDIHSITAKALTDAGEPTSRQEAKSRTFRPLYGGKSGTPAEVAYVKFFNDKYEGISNTQRSWALTVVNDKMLRTRYGMQFYWPDCKMDRSGYIKDTTSIYNYPIQGLATAEIIPIALVHFWHRTRGTKTVILNTIHDSIVARVHKDDVELYKELSVTCFTSDVYRFLKDCYGYEFVTPLGCGIKCSPHWGDTKNETSYNVYPDGRIDIKEK